MIRILLVIFLACIASLQAQEEVEKSVDSSPPESSLGYLLDDQHELGPGDQISFRIAEDRDEPRKLTVTDAGELEVPYLGRQQVAGLTCKALADKLKPMLEKDYYYTATVTIGLDSIRQVTKRIYILGQVVRPGPSEINPNQNLTVGKALLNVGGFTPEADQEHVKLIRQGTAESPPETHILDMTRILTEGRVDLDKQVKAEDLIVVPRQTEAEMNDRVYLFGQVAQQGALAIPEGGLTVSKAILAVGGFTEFARRNAVKVVRHRNDGTETKDEFTVDVGEILDKGSIENDMPLKPNDLVVVSKKFLNF